jgi:hypothetical protein
MPRELADHHRQEAGMILHVDAVAERLNDRQAARADMAHDLHQYQMKWCGTRRPLLAHQRISALLVGREPRGEQHVETRLHGSAEAEPAPRREDLESIADVKGQAFCTGCIALIFGDSPPRSSMSTRVRRHWPACQNQYSSHPAALPSPRTSFSRMSYRAVRPFITGSSWDASGDLKES